MDRGRPLRAVADLQGALQAVGRIDDQVGGAQAVADPGQRGGVLVHVQRRHGDVVQQAGQIAERAVERVGRQEADGGSRARGAEQVCGDPADAAGPDGGGRAGRVVVDGVVVDGAVVDGVVADRVADPFDQPPVAVEDAGLAGVDPGLVQPRCRQVDGR